MPKKVVWTQRMRPKERELVNEVLDRYMAETGIETKGEALAHYMKNAPRPTSRDPNVLTPEVYPPLDDFEATCPFGFLKKITNKYGREELWHCLKQQGPDSKGKPILLANGKNKNSIKAICETCIKRWQARPERRGLDQIRLAIKKLGDSVVTSALYFCWRDLEDEGLKMAVSESARIFCTERGRKVVIKKTCKKTLCPYLTEKIIALNITERLPFIEARKALEDNR